MQTLSYAHAIREGQAHLLEHFPEVFLLGLGAPTEHGVFGTTAGLVDDFGPDRVLDMPAAENGMTGIAIGASLLGMRPIMSHNRMDFALLAVEQLVNQAAKWHFMYGGQSTCPVTVRMLIGRGWGQGPQHSQSLQAWFAHIPGLKVVMPSFPRDAKGLLISSVLDDAPTIFLEHRWLHDVMGEVPSEPYSIPLGKASIARVGSDATVVSTSYMTLEALRAATILEPLDIDIEVVDLRTVLPLDMDTVLASVQRTGRLLVADTGQVAFGIGAEVLARVCESSVNLLATPQRLGLPFCQTPTARSLADSFYPRAIDIAKACVDMTRPGLAEKLVDPDEGIPLDQANSKFLGPY